MRRKPPTQVEQAQARERLITSLYRHGMPWLRAVDRVDTILDRMTWPDQDPDTLTLPILTYRTCNIPNLSSHPCDIRNGGVEGCVMGQDG